MAVVENGSSCGLHFEGKAAPDSHVDCDREKSNPILFVRNDSDTEWRTSSDSLNSSNQSFSSESQPLHNKSQLNETDATRHDDFSLVNENNGNGKGINQNGNDVQNPYEVLTKSDDSSGTVDDYKDGMAEELRRGDYKRNEEEDEGLKKNIRELEEMLSKLNPMAAEFVPSTMVKFPSARGNSDFGYVNNFVMPPSDAGDGIGYAGRRKKNIYGQGKRRLNARTSIAQREEVIRRTVYVSDIDHQVTEEQLAALFINCGQVVDCRVCGDPNSVLRFAFIEFTDEDGARNALSLSGTMLGYYPVRVLPSKTAIAPVNPTFLPRSEDEREMCARTVYVTNIDKKVMQADVKLFFESLCGEVNRLRLLGDYHHSTRIAFVEFIMAESAIAALNCSGAVLGSLPIRVSPSKTPVRPRSPRPLH